MKKYSSGSFIDAALRVYGSEADTITSFPASIISNGGNITPWTIYGNTSAGQSVGNASPNILDENNLIIGYYGGNENNYNQISADNKYRSFTLYLTAGTYTIYVTADEGIRLLRVNNDIIGVNNITITDEPYTFELSENTNIYTSFRNIATTANFTNLKVMVNEGAPMPYVPHSYKTLPVVIGSNTTNIYMADVLRMSSGADPVYDIMSSTGIITRNVDTDGTPLITPTTESFTAPTIATVAGSQSVSFDTTVKPSKAELTYTGWHTHSDKKRSGGAWV